MIFISITILKIFSIVVPLLISVAYFTIAERKIMAYVQRRKGPNVVGFIGLLQPLADGLKLFAKETVLPINANLNLFIFSPALSFVLSLIGWSVIPFSKGIVLCNLNLGILYLFTVSALNVYGILLAGWSSNSKYAYLGALRSAAQMISYEISLGFASLNVIICAGSFNLSNIVAAQEKI
jgi:NADH-quinone oxidoreductase subunit H